MPSLDDATRGRILFGGDYNPEQWPREVWHEDVRLMREAGVNLATVGVFSWAMLEPKPEARDFGWLDEVLELLHANGIGVALATPTASPPPWLSHRWPETLPRNPDGTVRTYGSRNAYCPSSPVYRRFANAITADLAARYAHHPALRMWHIGNEFGTVCHCDNCAERFRTWLQAKYSNESNAAADVPDIADASHAPNNSTALNNLNEAWGTAFWSQRYSDWSEVIPPRQVQYVINPTQDLDYQRFASDLLLEGFRAERDLVRAQNPQIPVTTNFMGFFKGTDSWRWAVEEDFVSLDSYPDPNDPGAARDGAMAQDLTRSLGGGKSWLMMEQSPAAAGWRHVATPKRPGLNRLWSMQAIARGADGILHFQWRASKQGAERTHGAMVPHAGPDSRVFREICELGKELSGLPDVLGESVSADVAILLDWDSWRAVELDHQPHGGWRYLDRIRDYYTPLWQANVTVDFAAPGSDLRKYRLVVAPNLYQVSDAAAANLVGYVERGGTLVMGPFSGVSDPDERIRLGGHPAPFRDLLGLRIEEYWPLPDGEPLELSSELFGDFTAESWAEWLTADGAAPLAEIASGPLAGIPAILFHAYGAGTAWYVATLPEARALARLLDLACIEAGVLPVLRGLPVGVEAVRRGDLVFVLDHIRGTVEVRPSR
ncbi:MAG TPA: beta-galactosidase [Actinocrinis sp.]|uniref:beta-galactosidase n=1 Tax=Actinocrinis sp. TaxID=1920516 RepID=UPI002DDC90EE|nr:beta-galactosidase [Actinocrinis sp.]HEV2342764.1 beta-galactosidase [Actinocrinis sp.]